LIYIVQRKGSDYRLIYDKVKRIICLGKRCAGYSEIECGNL